MGIITITVWIIHWLLVESDGFQRDSRECATKSSHGPAVFPSFRVRKGVIIPHRKEQCITKCDTLIRASSCDASGP